MALSASSGEEIDSRSAGLIDMLGSAPAIVLPPDTGYDLETANALYAALAEVLGGQTSPEDAVAGIDQKLG
jgi:raffinose/stachyose/melibiose transport system substrate-binding protein